MLPPCTLPAAGRVGNQSSCAQLGFHSGFGAAAHPPPAVQSTLSVTHYTFFYSPLCRGRGSGAVLPAWMTGGGGAPGSGGGGGPPAVPPPGDAGGAQVTSTAQALAILEAAARVRLHAAFFAACPLHCACTSVSTHHARLTCFLRNWAQAKRDKRKKHKKEKKGKKEKRSKKEKHSKHKKERRSRHGSSGSESSSGSGDSD